MGSTIGARAALLTAGLLASCSHEIPLPLPTQPGLAPNLSALDTQGVDISAPLRVTELAMLAVNNNPDLAATRAQRGVAQAQVLQAGILPNPGLSASASPLLAGPATAAFGSATPAYGLSITYDLRALITHGSRRREAAFNSRAVDATLLWQEWQTIAQARLLAVTIIEGDRLLAILRRAAALLRSRAEASGKALARGDATLAMTGPDISSWQVAEAAARDQERVQLGRRHQLNALLSLAPEVLLSLADAPDLPAIDPAAIRRDLASLPDRRPDLASLRYGYAAENAKLRTAILSQFPNFSLGVGTSSDNSNIRNIGPQAALELPIFDRNQGTIAAERATRRQLHAEYIARLATSVGQVGAALSEIDLLQRQLAHLRASLPPLSSDATAAAAAERAGNLDERTALDLLLAPLTRAQEITALEQSLDEQSVAIATLTGAGLPPLRVQESAP